MQETVTEQAIASKLESLKEQGVAEINAVQLLVAQTLLERAKSSKEGVKQRLLEKASKHLEGYDQQKKQKLTFHKPTLERIVAVNPHKTDAYLKAYKAGNHHQLELEKIRLESLESRKQHGLLNKVFDAEFDLEAENSGQLSFDDMLIQHENETILSFKIDEEGSPQEQQPTLNELKSHKLFKDSWVKIHADRLVAQAIEGAPENAGPLNSHMLAIKSIKAIQDVSPEYLNRFVSYMDTILWLNQSIQNLKSPEAKSKAKKKQR